MFNYNILQEFNDTQLTTLLSTLTSFTNDLNNVSSILILQVMFYFLLIYTQVINKFSIINSSTNSIEDHITSQQSIQKLLKTQALKSYNHPASSK